MAKVRAQIVLNRKGGLPEDVVVNTMHFEDDSGFSSSGGVGVNGPGLISRLVTFYQGLATLCLSDLLDGTGVIKLYEMEDPKPRSPRLEQAFTLPVSSGALPAEVACALSFQAAKVSGQAQARRRGRIFVGPLRTAALVAPANGADVRVKSATAIDMLTLAKTMATGGAGAFRLSVYSPTAAGATPTADAAWNDVVSFSVDDAPDTIRGRGARRRERHTILIAGSAAPALSAA